MKCITRSSRERSGDQLPVGTNEHTEPLSNNQNELSGDDAVNATLQTSGQLVIKSVTVYVEEPNPFPRNDCLPATETPPPTETRTPTITNTPNPTQTNTPGTPTATYTAEPQYCYEWDFAASNGGWIFFDVSPQLGFQNIGTYASGAWISTFNATRGARGVGIQRSFEGLAEWNINRVEVEYMSVLGGDTDPAGYPVAVGVQAYTSSSGTTIAWNSESTAWSPTFTTYIYEPSPVQTVGRLLLFGWSSVAEHDTGADHGGEIMFRKIRVFFTNGATSAPALGGAFCDDTPTPTPTVPTSTATVTSTNTPLPTITRTPIQATPPTATATQLAVATRTNAPTNPALPTWTAPPPTDWPTFPPPTYTRTPKNTITPQNTPTGIPLPTELYGTITPWGTPIEVNITGLPGTPDFSGIGTPGLGTLVGTPQMGQTIIATPDNLSDFYVVVEGNLQTAVAQVNALPSDITVVMPGTDNLPTFAGQAKWLMSGVSCQEIFGQQICPIPLHMSYGIIAILFISGVMLAFRVVMWFVNLANWIIRYILKIIPFIG